MNYASNTPTAPPTEAPPVVRLAICDGCGLVLHEGEAVPLADVGVVACGLCAGRYEDDCRENEEAYS